MTNTPSPTYNTIWLGTLTPNRNVIIIQPLCLQRSTIWWKVQGGMAEERAEDLPKLQVAGDEGGCRRVYATREERAAGRRQTVSLPLHPSPAAPLVSSFIFMLEVSR